MNMLQKLTPAADRRRTRERRASARLDASGAAVSVELDGGVKAAL